MSNVDDGTLEPIPTVSQFDQLEFDDPTPPEADKALIQGLLEAPNHIYTTSTGVAQPTDGITVIGVEKQWHAPETVTDEHGDVHLVTETPPVAPLSEVTS